MLSPTVVVVVVLCHEGSAVLVVVVRHFAGFLFVLERIVDEDGKISYLDVKFEI